MLSTHKFFWPAAVFALSLVSLCCAAALAQQGQGAPPANPVVVDQAAKLQALHRQAAERYAGIDSYLVRLRRREQVGGKNQPEEVMLFKFRKQPFSVYFKFLGPVGRGREVVYVKGQYEDKIHTLTAAGDIPLTPAGRHIALAPDSFLVRSKSRHPITEAGIGHLIDRFGQLLEFERRSGGNTGLVKYLGAYQRPEFAGKLDTVLQAVPARYESELPRGGRRYWFFDTTLHLPVLVLTLDEKGQEVEYNCFEDFQSPVAFTAEDFNPEYLGRHQ
jgi:hypothetical protein